MAQKEKGYWFTTENGVHVHVDEDETPRQAIERQFGASGGIRSTGGADAEFDNDYEQEFEEDSWMDNPEVKAQHISRDIGEYLTDNDLKQVERYADHLGVTKDEYIDKIALRLAKGESKNDAMEHAWDDFNDEMFGGPETEGKKGTYKFLVADGNAAATRGSEPDNISEIEINASNRNDAYKQLIAQMNGFDSFEEWAEDYGYSEEELEDFDAEDYVNDLDVGGGDFYIIKSSFNDEIEDGYYDEEGSYNIEPELAEKWGLSYNDYDDEEDDFDSDIEIDDDKKLPKDFTDDELLNELNKLDEFGDYTPEERLEKKKPLLEELTNREKNKLATANIEKAINSYGGKMPTEAQFIKDYESNWGKMSDEDKAYLHEQYKGSGLEGKQPKQDNPEPTDKSNAKVSEHTQQKVKEQVNDGVTEKLIGYLRQVLSENPEINQLSDEELIELIKLARKK